MTIDGYRDEPEALPIDGHVHSEWSWDASMGNMRASCQQAEDAGLPGIAFTEHFDLTSWHITPAVYRRLSPRYQRMVSPTSMLTPPPFDVDGYMSAIEECRARFPDLRILTGLEMGELNWHLLQFQELLSGHTFDRLLASSHSVTVAGHREMISDALNASVNPVEVLQAYFADLQETVRACDFFEVLAHVDYPLRDWPTSVPFPFSEVESAIRELLSDLANTGRAMEFNTVLPMDARLLAWWIDAGGRRLTFGSDAHQPADVGRHLNVASRLAREHGFREGRGGPLDFWTRH